jgi:putative ABC transport system ATP-binding protein
MSQNSILTLRQVTKFHQKGKQRITVLDQLDMEVLDSEFLALMGPSGSGKTTLLNLIGGVDRPSSGEIQFRGESLVTLREHELTNWRANNAGFVFQFYNLLPTLTASQNIEVPLLLKNFDRKERQRRVALVLDLVNLSHRSRHKPPEMSGGEQQRVSIARALVVDPLLILCDEPTGDLDRESADEILKLLNFCSNEMGKTVVMVTHDPEAAAYAHRTVHLHKGTLRMPGSIL